MAQAPAELLASIPKLQADKDAAALVALEDHEDKKVRKAARKAVHVLRSKGVEIPEKGTRSWSSGGLDSLRGDLSPRGLVDIGSVPGATRLVYSLAEEDDGGMLMMGIVGPEGRMLDFAAYLQTDGQRQRMLKDWDRTNHHRVVPADYVRARIRWSREHTLTLGHTPPQSLDDLLERLGDAPEARPTTFLAGELDGVTPHDGPVDELLRDIGVMRWPLLFDGKVLFDKLSEQGEGRDPASTSDQEKLDEIREAAAGDVAVREGLAGGIANALDDAAIALWLDEEDAKARRLVDLAAGFREGDAPEQTDDGVEVLRFQIAAVAMQQIASQGMGNPGHGQDGHVHGPDCDHDH